MKTADVKAALLGKFDTLSQRDGEFTLRRGFFYTHGNSAQTFVDAVMKAFPSANVTDSGEVWKPFRGGASVRCSSHWFVKFTV